MSAGPGFVHAGGRESGSNGLPGTYGKLASHVLP